MKLIVSVISTDDTSRLVDTLSAHGFDSTLVSSTGGFLRRGNDTVLVGAPEDRVDEVLTLIKETCHPHSEEGGESAEVEIGAATVFVLDVDRHEAF